MWSASVGASQGVVRELGGLAGLLSWRRWRPEIPVSSLVAIGNRCT